MAVLDLDFDLVKAPYSFCFYYLIAASGVPPRCVGSN